MRWLVIKMVDFSRQKIEAARMPPALVAKWSKPILSEGFVPFPKLLLRCLPKIFKGDNAIEKLAVILAIADFQRDGLKRYPSIEFLAFTADMKPADFQKLISSLEDEGLISVEENTNAEGETGLKISLDGLLTRIQILTKV